MRLMMSKRLAESVLNDSNTLLKVFQRYYLKRLKRAPWLQLDKNLIKLLKNRKKYDKIKKVNYIIIYS